MKSVLTGLIILIILMGCSPQIDSNGPKERCAKAMADMSTADTGRECNGLQVAVVNEAKKLALEINPNAKIEIEDESSKNKVVSKMEPSFDMTIDEYQDRFNRAAIGVGAEFRLKNIELKSGEVKNTANIKLNNNSSLIISSTKNGKFDGVISISRGDGTTKSGINMMLLSQVVFRSLDESLNTEEANKTALELLQKSVEVGNGKQITRAINGVEYFASFSKELGYFFGAQKIN